MSEPSDECVVEVDGTRYDVRVFRGPSSDGTPARARRVRSRQGALVASHGPVVAPIPGIVLQVHVADGDVVEVGQVLCVLEAMKMENEIAAAAAGTVHSLSIVPGSLVAGGEQLMRIEAIEPNP